MRALNQQRCWVSFAPVDIFFLLNACHLSVPAFSFKLAGSRSFGGLGEKEKEWKGEFYFVQMADTQLGMFKKNETWEEEAANMRAFVQCVNVMEPRPR